MFGDIVSNPYHVGALIRSDLTKALRSLVPEMLEEAQLAIPESLKIPGSADSVTLPVFNTMVNLVAHVSNRAMIGAPGCRNDRFLKRQVSVAAQAIPMAQVLNWFPKFSRRYQDIFLLLWVLTCAILQCGVEAIFNARRQQGRMRRTVKPLYSITD